MSSFFSMGVDFTEQDFSLAQAEARSLNQLHERQSEAQAFRSQQLAATTLSPGAQRKDGETKPGKPRPKAALPAFIQKRPVRSDAMDSGVGGSGSGDGVSDATSVGSGASCKGKEVAGDVKGKAKAVDICAAVTGNEAKRAKVEAGPPKVEAGAPVSLVAYGDSDDEDEDDEDQDEGKAEGGNPT